MRRFLIPLIFGLAGAGVLIALGVWQVQRLAWKQGVLAEIESRIAADPVAIPETPDPERDKYLPVVASGIFVGDDLRVLVSRKKIGAGYRIISAFDTDVGRIMVDRGFVPAGNQDWPPPELPVTVEGNLHWPDEVDGYTPAPDLDAALWFARDVPAMAAELGARPILLVAKDIDGTTFPTTPLPVSTEGIPNDHLQYAITWFSLAAVWLAMTGYFLWRTHHPVKGKDA